MDTKQMTRCVAAANEGPEALIALLEQFPESTLATRWAQRNKRWIGTINHPFEPLVTNGVYLAIDEERWDLVKALLQAILVHEKWQTPWEYLVSSASNVLSYEKIAFEKKLLTIGIKSLPTAHAHQGWEIVNKWFDPDSKTIARHRVWLEKAFLDAQRKRIATAAGSGKENLRPRKM